MKANSNGVAAAVARCAKVSTSHGDEKNHAAATEGCSSNSPRTPDFDEKPAAQQKRKPGAINPPQSTPNGAAKHEAAAGSCSSNSPGSPDSDEKPSAKQNGKAAASQGGKGGRPPALDEYARGKLVIALAIGLSQREAGAWVGCDQTTISLLLHRDQRLADDVDWYKRSARLHPFLKVFGEGSHNWKASAWLLEYLDKRHGRMTIDDLMAMLMNVWRMTRSSCGPEEATRSEMCGAPDKAESAPKASP